MNNCSEKGRHCINVDRTFADKVTATIEGGRLIGHESIDAECGIASFLVTKSRISARLSVTASGMTAEQCI